MHSLLSAIFGRKNLISLAFRCLISGLDCMLFVTSLKGGFVNIQSCNLCNLCVPNVVVPAGIAVVSEMGNESLFTVCFRGVSTTIDPFWDISLDLGPSSHLQQLPLRGRALWRASVLSRLQSTCTAQHWRKMMATLDFLGDLSVNGICFPFLCLENGHSMYRFLGKCTKGKHKRLASTFEQGYYWKLEI